jgi:hypothetical protein
MALDEWLEQLAVAAMMGTGRAGAPAEAPGIEAVDALLRKLPAGRAEETLLAAAAVADVCGRAGALSGAIAVSVSPAPEEDRPVVSEASSRQLGLMLAGHYAEVLPEYLELAGRAGQRVPAHCLPAMLGIAVRDQKIRPGILAVLGTRGQWLAAQNPEWAAMSAAPREEWYQTGTGAQRLAVLRHWRQTEPAKAREQIAATWKEEKPEDRAAFLETLAEGLSMEDEPFLEAALDDKRKEVRAAAAELLSHLADSRLCGRMAARLAPLVRVNKKLLGKRKLQVDVPATHDAVMARDGIDAKSSRPGLGDKASHLASIVAGTPLAFWAEAAQLDPPLLIKQSAELEWGEALLAGLAEAALRQRNIVFAAAILGHKAAEAQGETQRADVREIEGLVNLLSPAQREGLLGPLLGKEAISDGPVVMQILLACRHFWSRPFSERFIPLPWRLVEADGRNYGWRQGVEKVFALYADPAILPEVAAAAKGDAPVHSESLDSFLATLQFRRDIHKEF